jgi:polyketide synthase PksN
MMLRYGKLVPSINYTQSNEHIDFASSPFYVNTEYKDWEKLGGNTRLAAISSFGFSGTNAHVVVEEYVPPVDSRSPANKPYYLLSFSGKCEESLRGRLEEFRSWIAANSSADIRDISYTLGACREHFDLRAALVVRSTDEIADKIDAILKGRKLDTALVNWDKSKVSTADPVMKKLLRSTIENLSEENYKEDLLAIAGLYLQGHEVTWDALFKNEAVKKIPLPTYVFKKTRYWVEGGSAPKLVASNISNLHPMLDENISTIKEQSFRKVLKGNDFYIKDHVIAGNCLLPGVAYLEMARAAGNLASGHVVTSIENVVWSSPVVVSEDVEVQVKLYPEQDGLAYEIVSSGGGKHGQGMVKFGAVTAEKMEVPQVTGEKIEKAVLYERLKALGLGYGESFQTLEWVSVSADGKVLAKLKNPDKTAGYVLHPSMMDGMLQSMAALSKGSATAVPFSAGKIEILGKTPEEGYVYVDGGTLKLLDNFGNVVVKISDFVAREIQVVNEEDELVYYKFNWQAKALEGEARSDYIIYNADHDILQLFELVKGGIEKDLFVTYPVSDVALGEMLGGFAKTVNLEQNKFRIYVVGVENAEQINAEVKFVTTDIEVRYQENARYVKTPVEASASVQEMPIKQGDRILITGGQGGLGRIFANYLTDKYAAKVILMGRSAAKDSKYEYIQADISDAKSLANLPKIDGVIHAAGIIRDNFIGKKTVEEFKSVLSPKIDGLKNIAEIIKPTYCIVFSSIASSLGNAGQSDYAAANGFMDGYAGMHANYYAINWPLWAAGGMHIDAAAEELMATQGLQLLPTAEGIKAFEEALSYGGATVLYGKRSKLQRLVSSVRRVVKINTENLSAEILERLEEDLIQMVAEILKLDANHISKDENLTDYGFDSITLTEFANKMNKRYNMTINPSLYFEYATIARLAVYFLNAHPESFVQEEKSTVMVVEEAPRSRFVVSKEKPLPVVAAKVDDVAIIGMAGIFPGGELWSNLEAKKDLISEIPGDRWDYKQYPDVAKWGGFISDIDKFDGEFFKISPREAMLMDPQQRLLLQVVYQAIENAGYNLKALSGEKCKTGLFIGACTSDYMTLIERAGIEDAHIPTGISHSILANRISYLYDFSGPSESVDTACSSSLVAIHNAVRSLQSGDSDVAIASGVNALLSVGAYISFTQAGMLSPDGRCKTFDKDANGYVRGEGIGAIILKPLAKAEADGDYIYGVIKASGTNHGGAVNTLTAPNPNAQAQLLIDTYRKNGIDPASISYIECHGTGTPLGDPIEINGLKKAFAELGDKEVGHCGLGTVKTNIGHLEGSAGIAGVIKVLLAMQHKKLPGLATFKEINPYVQIENSPFYLVNETQEWRSAGLRRAGVSSFGFGGTNAHVVIEEYVPPADARSSASKPYYLLSFSGKCEESLRGRLEEFRSWIAANSSADIRDISYTLGACREHFDLRAALVVRSTDEIADKIEAILKGRKLDTALVNWDKAKVMSTSAAMRKTLEITINELKDSLPKEQYKNDLLTIADLYVQGHEVSWELLFKNEVVKKIPLPTYVFKKTRYWVEISQQRNLINNSVNTDLLRDALHYFKKFITSKFNTKLFSRRLDLNKIIDDIKIIIAGVLKIPPNQVVDQEFILNNGIDSILIMEITNKISNQYNISFELKEISTQLSITELANLVYQN